MSAPSVPLFDNYADVLWGVNAPAFWGELLNSVLVAIVAVGVTVGCASTAAFVFASAARICGSIWSSLTGYPPRRALRRPVQRRGTQGRPHTPALALTLHEGPYRCSGALAAPKLP